MRYKWDKKQGLLDDQGCQVLQIVSSNCSHKFRNMAGKELANKLNTIEQAKNIQRRSTDSEG